MASRPAPTVRFATVLRNFSVTGGLADHPLMPLEYADPDSHSAKFLPNNPTQSGHLDEPVPIRCGAQQAGVTTNVPPDPPSRAGQRSRGSERPCQRHVPHVPPLPSDEVLQAHQQVTTATSPHPETALAGTNPKVQVNVLVRGTFPPPPPGSRHERVPIATHPSERVKPVVSTTSPQPPPPPPRRSNPPLDVDPCTPQTRTPDRRVEPCSAQQGDVTMNVTASAPSNVTTGPDDEYSAVSDAPPPTSPRFGVDGPVPSRPEGWVASARAHLSSGRRFRPDSGGDPDRRGCHLLSW